MSDRPPLGPKLARTAALALSLGLASFVIVHAQFGCDSPASNAPPAKEPAKTDTPAAKPEAQPTEAQPTEAQPTEAQPTEVQPPTPSDDAPAPSPVFMPASKSGGDFGGMPFPGEPTPSQQPQQAPPK